MALRISYGECALHAAIVAVPVIILLVLGLQRLAPSGVFSVSAGTLERSPYINRILPQERAPESDLGYYVSLIADPAYMAVHLPDDDFDSVEVSLTYQNHGQEIFELGALTDIYSQGYDLQPIENTLLNKSTWDAVRQGDRLLLQRTPEYSTIDDFLADPPSRARIATYHDDLSTSYREKNYQALGGTQTFDVSLRGYHKLVTYVKNETFDFAFSYMDMNRTTGADEGFVRVWNEAGEVVYEHRFTDDNNTTENQVSSGPTTLNVEGQGWDEGVYTIELSGTSDIFWRRVVTSQRYATFINRVYIGDDVGYLSAERATNFYTDAKHCAFETFHADSPRFVKLGGEMVDLPTSHDKVEHDVFEVGVVAGQTPVGDLKMTCEGLFAFSPDSFFSPYPTRLTVNTDLDARAIDFILATYAAPIVDAEGWSTAMATFNLDSIAKQDGAVTFILSAPGISGGDAAIDIADVALTFTREPLTMRTALAKVWHALTPW